MDQKLPKNNTPSVEEDTAERDTTLGICYDFGAQPDRWTSDEQKLKRNPEQTSQARTAFG